MTIEKTWFGPAPTAPSGGVQPHGLGEPPTAPSRTSPTVGVRGAAADGAVTIVFVASPAGTKPFWVAWSFAFWNDCSPCECSGAIWLVGPWLLPSCRLLTSTVPYRLTVPGLKVVLGCNGAALPVGMISSMLAKRISSTRLFFMKSRAGISFEYNIFGSNRLRWENVAITRFSRID